MITQAQYDKWLERLRSGDLEQGTGHLKQHTHGELGKEHDKPFYCCLGVLADILVEDGILEEDTATDGEDIGEDGATIAKYALTYDPDGSETLYSELLPANLLDSELQNNFAAANDKGNPFTEIATIIEAERTNIIDPASTTST